MVANILSGLLIAIYAGYTRKNPVVWFLLGFFSPWISLILLCILPLLRKFLRPRVIVSSRAPSGSKATENPVTFEIPPSFSLHASPEDAAKLWYFLDEDNQTLGPMSFQSLYQKWKSGIVHTETLLWNETFTDWRPFHEVFPSARS